MIFMLGGLWEACPCFLKGCIQDHRFSCPVQQECLYHVVFLDFPIWWYVAPTIINTFLESTDFSGKKIIFFATSGGRKFGKTVEELKVSVSADTEIVEGKLLNGRQSIASVKAWTDTLGF